MTSIRFWILLFFLTLQFHCQNSTNTIQETKDHASSETIVPEDFTQFYERFHLDTQYQMQHIHFPLQGKPAMGQDSLLMDPFTWQKSEWKPHNFDHFDPNLFNVIRNTVDSTLVTERIIDRNTKMGIKRRFAKFGDEWYLIYYSAMNPQ